MHALAAVRSHRLECAIDERSVWLPSAAGEPHLTCRSESLGHLPVQTGGGPLQAAREEWVAVQWCSTGMAEQRGSCWTAQLPAAVFTTDKPVHGYLQGWRALRCKAG